VSESDAKLYLYLLREKRMARILIDSVLNQHTIFAKTEKIAQKKKTINDLHELVMRLISTTETPTTRKKTQDFMTHLRFHIDFMDLLQVAAIDMTLISNLLKSVLHFLFLFCQSCPNNQQLLLPFASKLLGLHKYRLKVSKLLHQIFACAKSQKKEKWLIDYLINELKTQENNSNPDIMRLLAALADTTSEKHSKYILKSLLALRMQKHIMLNSEESKEKQNMVYKWKRDNKGPAAISIKNHIYMITVVGNCAEHSEYGKIQGRKLISEDEIIENLSTGKVTYSLKTVYLRLYYSLYLYKHNSTEFSNHSKELPKSFPTILKNILIDLQRSEQYLSFLDQVYAKQKIIDIKSGLDTENHGPDEKNEGENQNNDLPAGNFENVATGIMTIARNQKKADDFEFLHNPVEYWKMLVPHKKIESNEKGGMLNFLSDTFGSNSWDLNDEILDIVKSIKNSLMELYDSLYRVQDNKDGPLDLEELAFNICKTIETLPVPQKMPQTTKFTLLPTTKPGELEKIDEKSGATTPPVKQGAETKGIMNNENSDNDDAKSDVPVNNEMPVKPTIVLNEDPNREKATFKETMKEITPMDDFMLRQKDSYDFVIETIKKYIMENNLTIREAFKLFDTNVDQKIDRLEMKCAIKEICKTQVTYQQIEDTIEYIEKNLGSGAQKGALAFAEFSTAIKKALKRAQYKNYKPRPDEDSEIQLEDADFVDSEKINISLKHFIIDYKRCIDYFPEDLELRELAQKISSIVFFKII